jgi:hypothetical protein
LGFFKGPPDLGARIAGQGCPLLFREYSTMKNPLDSLWGTVITGLVLTVVLYYLARSMMGG